MSELDWYSAQLRFVVMVESIGGDFFNDQVYLFKAKDFPDALERALSIGRAAEREYRNSNGELVCWRLMNVVSLDVLRTQELDGAEICANTIRLEPSERIPWGTTFTPEASKPIQTI
jgi:hypothetical protein